jgi:hypothetical protein
MSCWQVRTLRVSLKISRPEIALWRAVNPKSSDEIVKFEADAREIVQINSASALKFGISITPSVKNINFLIFSMKSSKIKKEKKNLKF